MELEEYDGAAPGVSMRFIQNTENNTQGWNGTWQQSKKITKLIENIKRLDEADINGISDPSDRTYKKHFIYSSEGNQCGVTLVSKALMDNGFFWTGINYDKGSDDKNFAFLSTENVGDSKKTKMKADEVQKYKQFLLPEDENDVKPENKHKAFNHPENSRGKNIRFLLIDKATKEGIDLYDVKYCHILEEPMSKADLIQIIGRGTRYCGQKKLNFVPDKGWELQIHQYHMGIPQEIRDENILDDKGKKLFDYNTLHEMYTSLYGNSGDVEEQEMKNDISMLGHYMSVDFPLTQTFINEEIDLQEYDLPLFSRPSTYDVMEPIATYTKYGKSPKIVKPPIVPQKPQSSPNKPKPPAADPKPQGSPKPKPPAVVSQKPQGSPKPKPPAAAPKPPAAAPKPPAAAPKPPVVVQQEPPASSGSSRPRRSQKKYVNEPKKLAVSDTFKTAKNQQTKVNANFVAPAGLRRGSRVRSPVDRFTPKDGNFFLNLLRQAQDYLGVTSSQGAVSRALSSQGAVSSQGASSSQQVPTTLSRVVSTRTSEHQKLHEAIAKKYGNPSGKQWIIIRPPKNGCENSSTEPQIATLTPSQVFLTKYFTPDSPQKGMLLWHSTGTGKTCTAISMASAEFERRGYRIVWVTRKSLVTDVKKNIYGANICHHRVDPKSEFFEERKKFFDDAKKNKTQPNQFNKMGKSWSIEPMTHKQFANFCCGNGRDDIVKQFNRSSEVDDDENDGWKRKQCAANLKKDEFYKTLIIIDEAHYLYSSEREPGDDWRNSIDKSDLQAIEAKIKNSYTKSGKNSARLLIMTATPVKKQSNEFFSLLNLCHEQVIPQTDIKSLYGNKSNWLEFIDKHISGYVSYLNREKDPSQFAQVSIIHHEVTMDQNLKNKILQQYTGKKSKAPPKPAKSRGNKAKASKPAKSGAKRGRPKKSAK